MNEHQPDPNGSPNDTWTRLEQCLIDFDLEWGSFGNDPLQRFVESTTRSFQSTPDFAKHQQRFLLETVKIDLEKGWKNQLRPSAESYLSRLPLDPTDLDELVEVEFELRHRLNELPLDAELINRFPNTHAKWQTHLRRYQSTPRDGSTETLGNTDTVTPAPTDPFKPFEAGDHVARYVLDRVIGRGAFADVWLARDATLNRSVAIKFIRAAGGNDSSMHLERLKREAIAVASIQHQAIADVYEVSEAQGRWFIVQQFIDGMSLDKLIAKQQLDDTASLKIVKQVAEAAHAAHECGIVHRDIKPANIIVDKDGNPFLVDFGLASLHSKNQKTLTQQGDMLGTPCYMAPELAQGNHYQVDRRTDVYSLGAVYFHCLTNHLPFDGSIARVLYDVVHKPIEAVTNSPEAKNLTTDQTTIIQRCMDKELAYRYGSALELAQELARLQKGEPLHARQAGYSERLAKWVRRKPFISAALAALILVAAGLAGSLLQLREVNRQKNAAKQLQAEAEATTIEKAIAAGRLAMDRGRTSEAIEELSFAVESMRERDIDVLTDLAKSLVIGGQSSAATEIIATIPEPRTPRQLARIQLLNALISMERSNNFDESIEIFEQLLPKLENKQDQLFVRAMLANSTKQATELIARSIKLDPLNYQANRFMSFLLFSQARFEESLIQLETALRLFPEDDDFLLLQAAAFACLGNKKTAQNILTNNQLDKETVNAWRSVVDDLHFVCSEYDHFGDTGIQFNEAAIADITKRFVDHVLPAFEKRAFRFPPKIGMRFEALYQTTVQFTQGKAAGPHFMDAIAALRPFHNEASLDCWVGGYHIKLGQVQLAQTAFSQACDGKEFIQATRPFKWIGLLATSTVLVLRGDNKDDAIFQDGIRAIEFIRQDQEAMTFLENNTNYLDPVTTFLIEAQNRGLCDYKQCLFWIDKCEKLGVVTDQGHLEWLKAVVYNNAELSLKALEHLQKVEDIGSFQSPSAKGMRSQYNVDLSQFGYEFETNPIDESSDQDENKSDQSEPNN